MAAKLTRLTHKIAIQLHLVVENCTICSSRSRRPVRKLLDTPSYEVTSVGPAVLCAHIRSRYFPITKGANFAETLRVPK
jgi:hypothetical protein